MTAERAPKQAGVKPQHAARASDRAPVLALSVEEACAALGISWDTWSEHVSHEVRIVRLGRRKLVAVAELEKWLASRGERIGDAV